MIRVKTTAFTYLNTKAFHTRAQIICDLLGSSTSPLFANPPIDINVLQDSVSAYQALLVESMGGAFIAIERRNTQRNIVTSQLLEIAAWAAFQVCKEMNAAGLLIDIGFVPTKEKRACVTELEIPTDVRSEASQEPGGIDISLRAVAFAHCYGIEISEEGNGPNIIFKHYGFSTNVRFTIHGLQRGKFYSIRLRAYNGKAGFSAPSQITSCMAG